ENEHIRLSIFDSVGRELKVLFDKRLPAGTHRVNFNGSGLPAGNYYVRIQGAGRRQLTRNVIKL
ncbi:MAG: T9SS type A sorting domain-containing protein, partial [Bacteroidota bacterium]